MKNLKAALAILVFIGLGLSSGCDNVNPDANPDDLSLNFEAFANVNGTFSGQDVAFVGDAISNKLYLAYKVFQEPTTDTGPVNINQIDLSNREQNIISYTPTEFPTASRQLLVDGDLLHMVAGRMISTFNFSQEREEPISQISTGTHMSRFGAFMRDGQIFTLGGRTGLDTEAAMQGDAICAWNAENESFEIIATLPQPKFWADAELVGNKAYSFGGQTSWADIENPQNSIFIYDFASNSTERLSLPKAVSWTYTAVYQDKIIVGGLIRTGTSAADADLDIFLGYFDTNKNEFVEVEHNLSDAGMNTLYDIAVVGDKLYALHGERSQSTLNVLSWTIFEADLDF